MKLPLLLECLVGEVSYFVGWHVEGYQTSVSHFTPMASHQLHQNR
jgi:hypothetical protein